MAADTFDPVLGLILMGTGNNNNNNWGNDLKNSALTLNSQGGGQARPESAAVLICIRY